MIRMLFAIAACCAAFANARGDEPAPAPLRVVNARPDDVMNAKFRGTDGWIGADGINSVLMPDDTTLWIFGDTLVGQVRDGKRFDVGMVNNTFARQRGWGPEAKVELLLNRDASGKPTSYIKPEKKEGYYWLWDGIVIDGKLNVFTTRLTSPGTITAFDWKLLDQSLLVIENPLDDPARWKVRQTNVPMSNFDGGLEIIWGFEAIRVDGYVYVYGTTRSDAKSTRFLNAGRVAPEHFAEFAHWEFYSDGTWGNSSESLARDVGTEGSITWLPDRQRYVYVYSPPLDPRIRMRTAKTPVGPWSEPVTIYTCPETEWDPRIFCYAGKARLVPGTNDELLISYATNSFDMLPHVTADARVYQPQFVRGRISE